MKAAHTVSGPGVDRSYPESRVALSAAQTFGARMATAATLYVRDPVGAVLWRLERDERGTLTTYTVKAAA
jgi:hypothetical protein